MVLSGGGVPLSVTLPVISAASAKFSEPSRAAAVIQGRYVFIVSRSNQHRHFSQPSIRKTARKVICETFHKVNSSVMLHFDVATSRSPGQREKIARGRTNCAC